MSQDYIALEWVKGEIEETLQQAQQALEAYVENPEDKSRLKFCLSYLHQIHGTLQMVEFYGAALLAEEMEAVANALANSSLEQERQGLEILMQAIIQLPHYLEHVKVGRRDLPVVLLPILNELRAARGETFLSETALFNPYIQHNAPLDPVQAQAVASEEFLHWARKIRQMLQAATLQLLQDKQPQVAKQYLTKAFSRLNKTLGTTPQGVVWLPALAFSEWLQQQQHLPHSARQLLQQLDTLLKDAIELGVNAIDQPPSDELIKNLLFYVARTEVHGDAIRQVQQRFNLAHALPSEEDIQQEREALAGPDRSTIGQVLIALIEEIATIKDQLDLLVRGSGDRMGVLTDLSVHIKQISDTMGMLGLGMPRRVMQEQLSAVALLIEQGAAPDEALLDIAGALLYAEATLNGMQREGNLKAHLNESALSDAQKAVLREARNVLEQVKDAIIAYIANHWASQELADVPTLLHSIEGSLAMIPLPKVAALLSVAADFVMQRLIIQGEHPQWSEMDTFADVLSGVEYYIERYTENPRNAGADLLDKAELSLQNLTGILASKHVSTPANVAEDEPQEIELAALLPSVDDAAPANPEESQDSVLELIDTPAPAAPPQARVEVEDDLIDDEIIEIFLEEAEEVLETILEFWPQLIADHENNEALTTVRRAFHTLKGSGRMVKALVVGELAWSIENMFNRVLDKSIVLSNNLVALVDHTIAQLPSLIDDFRNRRAPSLETQPLIDYATALADGAALPPFQLSDSSAPVHAAATHEDDDESDVDESLLEIFDNEARSHLDVLDDFIQESIALDYSNSLSDQLQRTLHTLKGSAHMAGINSVANLATPLEKLVKELRAYQLNNNEQLVSLLTRSSMLIHNILDDRTLLMAIELPETNELIAEITAAEQQLLIETRANKEVRTGPNPEAIAQFMAHGMETLLEADALLQQWQQHQEPSTLLALRHDLREVAHTAKNADLIHIQLLAEVLDEFYQRIEDEQAQANDELITVISAAHEALLSMLDYLAAGQETTRPETILEQLRNWQFEPIHGADADAFPVVEVLEFDQEPNLNAGSEINDIEFNDIELNDVELIEELELNADSFLVADSEIEDAEFIEELTLTPASFLSDDTHTAAVEITKEPSVTPTALDDSDDDQPLALDIGEDFELLEIFLEEAQEISESVEVALDRWRTIPDDLLQVAQLQRELHTLKGGARMAGISAVADLCHELETLYEYISGGRIGVQPTIFGLLERAHDTLNLQLDRVRASFEPKPAAALILEIHRYLKGTHSDAAESTAPVIVADAPLTSQTTTVSAPPPMDDQILSEALDSADREILVIFLEEAQELHDGLDKALQDWQHDHNDLKAPEEAQRILHTLKGGANLAGLRHIGDLTHRFETIILRAQQGHTPTDAAFFKQIEQQQDQLLVYIEQVNHALQGGELISLSEPSLTLTAEETTESEPTSVTTDVIDAAVDVPTDIDTNDADSTESASNTTENSSTNVVPLRKATPTAVAPAAPKAPPAPQQAAAAKTPQELVRVSADLLDSLVNLAGETSIGRGRLEQQVSDFSHTLEEMDMTLERLRDQLRRLDMETEAQVLFRQERQSPEYEDFDPLEMDRYSTIQQLSRALVESTSDLIDLKETLTHKNRDAETLLLQQSRVNTELQEGLMKTRMVPFQQLVPRLRRIVRQVGQELGKQVELRIHNASGEMDRSILERMISPLEHMLRNSLDHGIETAAQRATSGKPDVGMIDIDVSRDGGDVLISVSDDGRGINIEAVRKKAIERGLIPENSQISEQEILQFILQAGFSTAQAVTQISGRGVGMDVVASEIKQMGGTIDIRSEAGVGSSFIIRLPFTVSVNRALMIKMGDDLYAVPLNNIQGIVRVPVPQLHALYAQPTEERNYRYAETDYRLDYLGSMLDNNVIPKAPAQTMPVPVLLVRGVKPYALQVDSLLGSREIVVKTLGPQFAGVMGVSGGTILGDGSVVIILDLPAMIRAQASVEYQQARELELQAAERRQLKDQRLPKIMVVDDSVTVRKVTSRLLERNGMEVITAKDGIDAITTLQEHIPDLILLDIEMPRMDGFEVASQVRHSERLKHIPIIMITSRTGDKHRDRAMSIGVNEYLGKPFQEDILLGTINRLLEREDY